MFVSAQRKYALDSAGLHAAILPSENVESGEPLQHAPNT